MPRRARKPLPPMQQQPEQQRPLIRRVTQLGMAMVAAFEAVGIDTSAARLPVKREPTWRVNRKA